MLSALSAEMGKQGKALNEQGERLVALEAALVDVGKRLKRVTDAPREPAVPVWCWSTMDADDAAEAWVELTAWVAEVLQERHPQSRAALTKCWYRHPEVVEELSALLAAWKKAFMLADSTPPAGIEWLDRWLPGVLRRVPDHLQRCVNARKHEQQVGSTVIVDPNALADWVEADLAERR